MIRIMGRATATAMGKAMATAMGKAMATAHRGIES